MHGAVGIWIGAKCVCDIFLGVLRVLRVLKLTLQTQNSVVKRKNKTINLGTNKKKNINQSIHMSLVGTSQVSIRKETQNKHRKMST